MKKNFLGGRGQIGSAVLPFSHCCIISFCDIAQDCSLGQCLTSSRAEISKEKKIMAQIVAQMIFSILSLSIHSNLLVFG